MKFKEWLYYIDVGNPVDENLSFIAKTFAQGNEVFASIINHPEFEVTKIDVKKVTWQDLVNYYSDKESNMIAVKVQAKNAVDGIIYFFTPKEEAKILAHVLLGGEPDEEVPAQLQDFHLEALKEAVNRWCSEHIAEQFSMVANNFVELSPIEVEELAIREGVDLGLGENLIVTEYAIKLNETLSTYYLIVMSEEFANAIYQASQNISQEQPAQEQQQEELTDNLEVSQDEIANLLGQLGASPSDSTTPTDTGSSASTGNSAQNEIDAMLNGLLNSSDNSNSASTNQSQATAGDAAILDRPNDSMLITGGNKVASNEARPVDFADFSNQNITRVEVPKNLEVLMDVPLTLKVELGRAILKIREILELSPGTVVELDKLAGENVDIFVNDKLIAKGEIVIIDENFGVRITSIVNPMERIKFGG